MLIIKNDNGKKFPSECADSQTTTSIENGKKEKMVSSYQARGYLLNTWRTTYKNCEIVFLSLTIFGLNSTLFSSLDKALHVYYLYIY